MRQALEARDRDCKEKIRETNLHFDAKLDTANGQVEALTTQLAEATLETSSQMLPVSESHWADEPESGSGRDGSAVPGRASVRV